jgi:hypothetical protein
MNGVFDGIERTEYWRAFHRGRPKWSREMTVHPPPPQRPPTDTDSAKTGRLS